ncbi:hypothetical protein MKX01_001028 [Papaver californicum]|nr:hypothetical protein MKX01_001028 [Papaver californicum]
MGSSMDCACLLITGNVPSSFTPELGAPESVILPASPPLDSTTLTAISGRRPVLTPTNAAHTKLPHLSTTSLLFAFAVLLLKY